MSTLLLEALRNSAARNPGAPAIVWRNTKWSYADLVSAAARVSNVLAARGVQSGARIALLMRNSPQYVACYYGVLGAGCAVVALNSHERANVLARQLEHSGAELLIADRDHVEFEPLRRLAAEQGVAVMPISLGDDEHSQSLFAQEFGASELSWAPAAPQDLAMIIYTSGTTGRPKGVMISHGNLAANTAAIIEYLGLHCGDRGLCVLPFHFSYGNSMLHTHLAAGATLFIEDNFAFPQVVLRRMQDEAVTGFSGVPSTFALLLGRCRLQDYDLSSLRYITQAGGAMPRPLIQRLRTELPSARLFVMYGQTEATARLTYLDPADLDRKLGSVGKPVAGVEIQVCDASGRELPPGEIGEIRARGPNIMLGYWRDPQATQQVLRDGWLYTGDLGHKDNEGFLYIDGRAVEMIKVGAFRVSPQEVEEVIAALPDVEEVAVTAIPDELLGQAIKAVIVPRAGKKLNVLQIKAHCREHLAAYKVPKVVEFASSLPRTSSGKIQRFKLA
ncbi:MAG: class I adenylate-forming enzyme family protein [Gammaproteobacteria bacterium]|nr:AMP-dependent synthetase [Gammaproteobacteria bacterium]